MRRLLIVFLWLVAFVSPSAAVGGFEAEQLGAHRLQLTFRADPSDEPLVQCEGTKLAITFFEDLPMEPSPGAPVPPLIRRWRIDRTGRRTTLGLTLAAPVAEWRTLPVQDGWTVDLGVKKEEGFSPRERIALPEGTVTLTLSDAPLSGALELVAKQTGYNLLARDVPSAPVTLSVQKAPAERVLGLLLGGTGLSWAVVGRTLAVAPRDELRSALGTQGFEAYSLRHADAESVAKTLGELLAGDGTVTFDGRTRQIFVVGDAATQARARKALEGLDRALPQIALKARIIEVSDSATKDVENLLAAVYRQFFLTVSNGTALLGGGTLLPRPDWANRASNALDLQLGSLVAQGKARVLADPTVVVLDGHSAVIKLVDRVRYITGRDEGKNPSYSDEEIGPQLEVTPRWDGDESITVDLELKTGEITQWKRGGQGEELPQVSEREVKTRVRVPSGVPFVIGGLFKETESRHESKTPLLGDLPLIGGLFRTVHLKTESGQVVMILTPQLLD